MNHSILKRFSCLLVLISVILLSGCILPNTSNSNSNSNERSLDKETISASLDQTSAVQDHGTNVGLTPIILINFSKEIIPSLVDQKSVKLQAINNPTAPDYNLSVLNNRVAIDMKSPLSPDTQYTITVTNAISNSLGEQVRDIVFDFKTGKTIFPTAAILSPTNGSRNITKHPLIQIHFSSQVDHIEKNKTVVLLDSHDNPTGISDIDYSPEKKINNISYTNIYTFSPIKDLNPTEQYTIKLTSDITDMKQNHLKESIFNFTTNTTNNPEVSVLSPHDNEVGVSISTIVSVRFSTAVQGVSNSTVQIHQGSEKGDVVDGINIDSSDNITFRLKVPSLTVGTNYYITFNDDKIRSIDTDDCLIKIPASVFTTGSASNPTV